MGAYLLINIEELVFFNFNTFSTENQIYYKRGLQMIGLTNYKTLSKPFNLHQINFL